MKKTQFGIKRTLSGLFLASICLAAVAISLLSGCMSGASESGMSTDGGAKGGKSGSLARFQIVGEHLYALSGNSLHVYGISDPAAISFQGYSDVGFGIETLFARGSKLYIGSQTGMHIYDITDRVAPVKTAEMTHIRSCDPVVVEGDLAYLTLRSGGSRCWGGNNELQIIDIKDSYAPVKLKTFPMANPHGLGIDGEKLFICDGYAGLKVYKVGADFSISLTERVDGIEAFDVIPGTGSGKILILIAKEGLFQYDYGEYPMKQLSLIKIGS
ncbi:MAG: hypothetical protein M3Y08_16240 [Fibrobacterota bacterium]|nr:hypothetical protein [Fibrobacterota bacterium]